ncbi:toxin co-regulated pilus biosynthesis Q family protein [Pantoea agglomerans]|uniref:toxin co-regulated pilus biosynthesis Q family protein n=1 Tax=Enterobacter agglomerans TaxID=549 RepID=UPI00320A1748
MLSNRIVISGLIINSLAACSSPMELSQPQGDWVDFDTASTAPVQTARTMSTITPAVSRSEYRSMPASTSYSGLDNMVTGNGKRVPLFKAVRSIVPASWDVQLAPDVLNGFKGTVSWEGNDRWPFVLRKSLAAAGLEPQINESLKKVTVRYISPVSKAVMPPTAKSVIAPAKAAASPAVIKSDATPATKLPSGGMLKLPVVPVVTPPFKQSSDHIKPAVPAVQIKPAEPVMPKLKIWRIDKGSTLRQGFESWAAQSSCPGPGGKWSVRWDSATNYPIDYSLTFTAADFEAATAQLFNLYQHAQVPLYVSGYRQQCLIVISDRK